MPRSPVLERAQSGTHYYAVVAHGDSTKTLFVIASVLKPRVSWHLYKAEPIAPRWAEDMFLSNYFGPVDSWRRRLLTLDEAKDILEAWGGALLPDY